MKKVLTAVLAGVGMIGAVSTSILHASCYPLPGGAVSWWQSESNSYDIRGLNHASILGETSYAEGKVGLAFNLSGSNAVVVPADPSLVFSSLTIEGWINGANVSSAQPVVDFTTPSNRVGTHLWIGYPGTGNLTANLRGTNLVDHFIASPGGVIPANQWTHIALTYDRANGTARLFVNSSNVASANLGVFTPLTSNQLNLGYRPANQDTQQPQFFTGKLDEFTIYNRALSTNEIAAIVSAGADGKCLPAPPPCAPVPTEATSWWSGEGNVFDRIGTNNLSLSGGTSFVNGMVGNAFAFDGINDALSAPAMPTISGTNFSIEAWIFPADLTKAQPIFEFAESGTAGVLLWLNMNCSGNINSPAPGGLMANLHDTSGGWHILCTPTNAVIANEWNHIALTYDKVSGLGSIYVNGMLMASSNLGSFSPRNGIKFNIGNRAPYFFAGKMDEVAVYSRTLAETEISAIYSAASSGKCLQAVPPSLISLNTNIIIRAGRSLLLNANATGSAPLHFQWFHNDFPVVGGTNSVHFIQTANTNHSGQYSIVISNHVGAITGTVATVQVDPVQCTRLNDGMVSWWQAENDGMDSAGTNNAILLNDIGFAPGMVGYGFNFDGINDGVTILNNGSLSVSNFAIEGWIWPKDLSYHQPLVEFSAPYSYGVVFWLNMTEANLYQVSSGSLFANITDTSGGWHLISSPAGSVNTNQWNHIALTYDKGTGIGALYVNGAVVASKNMGIFTPDTSQPLNIGNRLPTYFFAGKMDEFALYSRALNTNEIFDIYYAGGLGKCGPQIPPSVVTTSTNLIVGLGGPMTLQANASGTAPLFYQWLFNGTNLDGSTAGSLTIPVARMEDSGEYSVIVSNAFGVVTGLVANVSVQPLPPTIVTQPMSQSVAAGTPASFAVAVSGTPPFYFQWYFEGEPLLNATNATLTIPAAFSANAGAYQVAASNELDSVLSTTAVLTVIYPTARVFVPNATTQSGRTLAVPVYLVANGNENALQFSVGFSTTRLTLLGVEPGEAVGTAAFLPNTNALANGRVGITLSLPTSQTFPFGTQEVARLIFQTAPMTNNSTTSLNFYDTPVGRQLVDAQARTLNVNFAGGTVSLAPIEYEADVAPRGTTDRRVMANDWVQVGRFVAALDAPSAGDEFQRADCAPRSEGGNGILSATDWVQAGRYAAGLDALVMANGPTDFATLPGLVRTAQPTSTGNGAACTVSIAETTLVAGEVSRFQLTLTSSGAESALTFTLRFDPAQMTFVRAAAAQATLQPTLNLNTNQLAVGKLGVALMLPAGQSYAAGEQQLISLEFHMAATAREPIALDFDGTLIAREVSTAQAESMATTWLGRTLKVALPAPVALLGETPGMMTFRWPTALGNVLLEATDDLAAPDWQPVKQNPAAVNGQNEVSLPTDEARKFYRLRTE